MDESGVFTRVRSTLKKDQEKIILLWTISSQDLQILEF